MTRGIRDVGWVTVSLAVRQAVAFVTTILASRLLSISEFADYLVAVTATVIFIPLADAGMWPVVTRVTSRSPDAPLLTFVRVAFTKRLPFWILLSVAIAAGSLLLNGGVRWLPALAFAGAVGQANLDSICGEFFGRKRFAVGGVLRIASAVCGLCGMAVLLVAPRTATIAMTIFAASRVLPPLLVALAVRPAAGRAREITWSVSYAFGLVAFLQVVYIRSDILLLTAFGTEKATIALYGVLYNVLIATQLVPSSLAAALYPRIAAAKEGRWEDIFQFGLSASLLTSLAACAVIFLDPRLVVALFGSRYASHVLPLRTLLLVILPISLSSMATSGMQGRDKERVLLRVTVGVLVANIAGNVALIPIWGARGAIVATVSAECLSVVGSFLVVGPSIWRRVSLWPLVLIAAALAISYSSVPSILISALLLVALASLLLANTFRSRDLLVGLAPRLKSGATSMGTDTR